MLSIRTLVSILLSLHLSPFEAKVVESATQIINEGVFNYYYDDSITPTCEAVVFIGVGTAMQSSNYINLSRYVVSGESVVVVIIDDNPKRIRKQNPMKFAKLVNKIVSSLKEYIPICNLSEGKEPSYVVGGHSGGGQGAIDALPLLSFDPIGFLGLDPFKVPKDGAISIPALFWGLSRTSCSVSKYKAAKLGYEISNESYRVFYQVQTDNWNIVTGGPHCIFTDEGCPGWKWLPFRICGGTSREVEQIPPAVGKSINVFIKAIESPDGFERKAFEEILVNGTILFFNEEEVKK